MIPLEGSVAKEKKTSSYRVVFLSSSRAKTKYKIQVQVIKCKIIYRFNIKPFFLNFTHYSSSLLSKIYIRSVLIAGMIIQLMESIYNQYLH